MSSQTIKSILISLALLLTSANKGLASTNLSLEQYLTQVKQCNAGFQGSTLIAIGAKQREQEAKQVTSPKLFGEGQYIKNAYDPSWSPIAGNSNSLQSYQVGISQTTPYGVQGKLYYNYQHQSIYGLPAPLSQSQATASSPILELNMPLARNWAGRETRATAELIRQQAKLTHHLEKYKLQMLLADAEAAYWRLAIARNILSIQKESLHRTEKIEQWLKNRLDYKLASKADNLQAHAAVMNRLLDLEGASNDEQLASENFNRLRGFNEGRVCECLCSYHSQARPDLPAVRGPREDVKAAQAQEQIAIANARLGIEKNKPILELYASYALNGNNPSSNAAVSESFSLNYPSTAIGLRFSMPLDFWHSYPVRKGYQRELQGAKCQFEQKCFEDKCLFNSLYTKLNSANQRFEIANELEKIQCLKLQAERQRLSNGKTTTYQVLMFEQDYANAQISRLILQDGILSLTAQLKTFCGNYLAQDCK